MEGNTVKKSKQDQTPVWSYQERELLRTIWSKNLLKGIEVEDKKDVASIHEHHPTIGLNITSISPENK